MHDSAHDKAQRRRGVLLRRGKCVQRALRGVVTRLRTRRTLVATAALMLLVLALLALCHARLLSRRPAHRDGAHNNATADAVADDSTPRIAASPTDRWLLRPDAQHGGSVRVMLLMVSTDVDTQLCYALASAYFADLPVVVLGYGARPFVNAMKPSLYLDAIERAGLRDRDVVLLLDSDILFSGEDMLPFIDDYIARSPAAPSALDVRAVRAGTARAPSLYEAQYRCSAPNTYDTLHIPCVHMLEPLYQQIYNYVKRTNTKYYLPHRYDNPLQYLNSGVSIHRVWSARELLRAYVTYTTQHEANVDGRKGWYSDQSVLALFYNDLRAWEVEHDVLRNNNTAAATQRGPHGLRAGQLQLEQTGRMSTGYVHRWWCPLKLTNLLWRYNISDSHKSEMSIMQNGTDKYTHNLWQRYGGGVRLQQRTLTRAGNGTHTIDLTPPMLSIKTTTTTVSTHSVKETYPLMLHLHGPDKLSRLPRATTYLTWYAPMYYNSTKWQQASAHLLSSHIELWTATKTTQRLRYGDMCHRRHPFVVAPRSS